MASSSRKFAPDCARCAALCCVAFAFDKSDEFGHDKAADEGCRHLDTDYLCTIHSQLKTRGYGGCVRFDCFGAGQKVTQELFGGGDWQKDPSLTARMSAAFRVMRQVQEWLMLLDTAEALTHAAGMDAQRRQLVALLEPDDGWSENKLQGFELDGMSEAVGRFLRSLAGGVVRV